MRVLLISANTEQLQMPVLPMGLACIATAAEKAGHEVRFLNLMTREDSRDLLDSAVTDFRPAVIGISVRNVDNQFMQAPKFLLDGVKDIVTRCRNLTSAPIVLGGAGYSIYPRSALAYLEADMGIQGEGEAAFVTLLDRLSRNENLSDIPGLILPHTIPASPKYSTARLDEFQIPVPDGVLSFPKTFQNQAIWLPFQTRRGCPMDCSYCSTAAIEGRILRKRATEPVVESLSRFAEAGFNNFFFVDNTFNFPASYAKELCDKITERRLDIRWRAILYPWKVDEELIEKMVRAGCVEVAFGFESGSEKQLCSMNKRFRPGEVRLISQMLEKYEVDRMGFLLLGGPGETRQTVEESLSFADSLDLESIKITVGVRIYPHTTLSTIAAGEGIIAPDDDLLFPTFYLAKGLDGWLQETLTAWMSKRPHWHW
jgi:radical SAM superfamily enzyme YgiQ (UPF0313 family)